MSNSTHNFAASTLAAASSFSAARAAARAARPTAVVGGDSAKKALTLLARAPLSNSASSARWVSRPRSGQVGFAARKARISAAVP